MTAAVQPNNRAAHKGKLVMRPASGTTPLSIASRTGWSKNQRMDPKIVWVARMAPNSGSPAAGGWRPGLHRRPSRNSPPLAPPQEERDPPTNEAGGQAKKEGRPLEPAPGARDGALPEKAYLTVSSWE